MTDTIKTNNHKEVLSIKKRSIKKLRPSDYADGILVTGANSFIGTHVVRELAKRWKGSIHLLIRASTVADASYKMNHVLKKWVDGSVTASKLFIHSGDMTIKNMGLKAKEYELLKKETGFVLHLSMTPMYNLPYSHFKRLWLPELHRMIEFCNDNGYPKSLHYLSTFLTVLINCKEEYFDKLNINIWQSGYAGFKRVANKILETAFSRNLKGCLYNVPFVLGTHEKGLCPVHYPIWQLIDVFLKTGLYTDFTFRIIPVDILSEVIVKNLLNDRQGNGSRLIVPVLNEPVTHRQLGNMVAGILGLRHASPEKLKEAFADKKNFDYIIPSGFTGMLEKLNNLSALWPEGFQTQKLPPAHLVFLSNLNRILAKEVMVEYK